MIDEFVDIKELYDLPSIPITDSPNKLKIPLTKYGMEEEDLCLFNSIFAQLKEMELNGNIHRIEFTKSGGIKLDKTKSVIGIRLPAYGVRKTNWSIEVVICSQQMTRISFSSAHEKTAGMTGRTAFHIFERLCKKFGIDLESYAVDNGPEIKKTIPKYRIEFTNDLYKGLVLHNCHHMDFHSSFPAGLKNTHPEFGTLLTALYEKRKLNPQYKAILNFTIGYMQSVSGCKAKYATLAKDAIKDNNDRIEDLTRRLRASGRVPILYNTDGIWYSGDVYHGEGEGDKLGDWANDYTNCDLLIKSRGAYQFIYEGKCYTKVRGRTVLDRTKPRDDKGLGWDFGDILEEDAQIVQYIFDENTGLNEIYTEES